MTMDRIIVALLACLACSFLRGAPALYQIRTPTSTMYLFGTIHILPSDAVWLKGPIQSALEQSDLLMLEKPEDIGFFDKVSIAGHVLFHARPTIKARIRHEQYRKLRKIIQDRDIEILDHMPTVVAQGLVEMKLYEKASGKRFDGSVEATLAKVAQSQKKAMAGFETAREQFAALCAIPETEIITGLEALIDAFDAPSEGRSQVFEAWLRGDAAESTEGVLSMRKNSPHMYEVLIRKRNVNWLKWIDRRLKKPGVTFVAVGASHLVGPDGLIESLKGRGFEVVRVAE